MSDEGEKNTAVDEADQFLRSTLRASKEIQTKFHDVEESINQLRSVTKPYAELSNSLRNLAERYQQQRRTISQLRAQNQDIQAEKDRMIESLSKAVDEKKSMEDSLAALQVEKKEMQTQISALIREREGLLKMQAGTTQQIASLRTNEHEINLNMSKLSTELRVKSNYAEELEKKLLVERQEWKHHLERNERDVVKRMEGQKAELERQHSYKLQTEVKEYEMKHRQMKKTFENALKEAELETKKLAAERNEWFTKFNQLASDLEERKRRLDADVQKLLSEKWQEMMRSFSRHQASQNTREANLMIRRPENLASKFMEELISSYASDASVSEHDQNDAPENAENVPPVPKAFKKSTSVGVRGRTPLIQDAAGKAISSHVYSRDFRSNTPKQKQLQ